MWLNFRFDKTAMRTYWATGVAPVEGPGKASVEVPPEWEDDPGKLVAFATAWNCDTCKAQNAAGGVVTLPMSGNISASQHSGDQCWGYNPGYIDYITYLPTSQALPEP
jgi:hypothetical protein